MSFEQDVYMRSNEKLASILNPAPGVNFNPAALAVPALGALGGLGWGLYDDDDTSTLIGKTLGGAGAGIALTGLHGMIGGLGYYGRIADLLNKARGKMDEVRNRGWSAVPFEKDQMRGWDKYFRRLGGAGELNKINEAMGASNKIMLATGIPLSLAGAALRKDYDAYGNYVPVEER